MSGLYFHIPFCRKACTYCDFHFSTNLGNKKKLVDAVCDEIAARKEYLQDKNLRSVYFGGGTPSVLNFAELEKIFLAIHKNFTVVPNAEITLEMNPEDAAIDYLQGIKQAGINRLSIGLQSFNDDELKWMNRSHTAEQNITAVKNAQQTGIKNISIDLIYGSRFQTEKTWRDALQKTFELDVQHISAYNLTIEGKTKLNHLLQQKTEPEVDTELSAKLFDILMEETAKNSFEQYEISNFCRPGFMAVHNSNYWRGSPYLGIGPSAHSYNGTCRSFNVKSNAQYIQCVEEGKAHCEEEILSEIDKYNEYILTRLRTSWGCDLKEMKELFGEKYVSYFIERSGKHKQHISANKNSVTLTQQGRHFADAIASDLFYIA
ncbi:MAG TPA: radical SAM family heme chaperone HemW [Bacteroidia bacterium]|jgi:oxygen-independent coproporphyrinogen-3 oxidase|nr:radical SAM family heme chaperone HemW [Bacteroidia bacterium]